jgi:hypothetical protein
MAPERPSGASSIEPGPALLAHFPPPSSRPGPDWPGACFDSGNAGTENHRAEEEATNAAKPGTYHCSIACGRMPGRADRRGLAGVRTADGATFGKPARLPDHRAMQFQAGWGLPRLHLSLSLPAVQGGQISFVRWSGRPAAGLSPSRLHLGITGKRRPERRERNVSRWLPLEFTVAMPVAFRRVPCWPAALRARPPAPTSRPLFRDGR